MDINWEKIHDKMKYIDPAGRAAVDGTWKLSTRSVNKTSDGLATTAEKWGINSKFPRFWEGQSEKDINSIDRWIENTGAVAGAVYGGMSAAGGSGGGAASGGGAGTYTEVGGGVVSDAAGGGFTWSGGSAGSGSTGALGQGGGGWTWADGLKQGGNAMQQGGGQRQPEEELEESKVDFERPDYAGDPYAYSSKKLKTRPRTSMRAVMERGASGADPIDQNGVHMAAIQALTAQVENAKARLAKLKGKNA